MPASVISWVLLVKALLASLCCQLLTPAAASAAIIQCRDASGGQQFAQFECPPGSHPVEPDGWTTGNLTIIATAPLSDSERRVLADLEKALEADRRRRAHDRQKSARRRAKQAAADRALCDDAVRHLEDLNDTRRKGYSASSERRLEAEEARWREMKKAAC